MQGIRHALDAAVAAGTGPAEMVRAGNEMFLDMYRRHAAMLSLIEQLGSSDESFRMMRVDLRHRLVRRVHRAILTLGEYDGADLSGLDTAVLAAALAGMVEHLALSIYVMGEPFKDDDLATLDQIWLRSLGFRER